MSWFLRGVQSAIFYYVSCAPCTKYTARKKRQKQVERDRKERELNHLQTPEAYRHPSPYRTNEFWAEEIRLGPGPPPRNVSRKQRETRRQARGRDKEPRALLQELRITPDAPDILTVDGMKEKLKQMNEKWRRYQREDEELWGSKSASMEALDLEDSRYGPIRPGSVGGSSVGFPGMVSIQQQQSGLPHVHFGRHPGASTENFWTARNPPINDMHPPVVSNPACNTIGNRWMMQPPPSSAIMNGYDTPKASSRRGSGSGFVPGTGSAGNLRRQVSKRSVKNKLHTVVEGDINGPAASDVVEKPASRDSPGRAQARRILLESRRDSRSDTIRGPSGGVFQPLVVQPASSSPKRKQFTMSNLARETSNTLQSPVECSPGQTVISGTPDSGVDLDAASTREWQQPFAADDERTATHDFAFLPNLTREDSTTSGMHSSNFTQPYATSRPSIHGKRSKTATSPRSYRSQMKDPQHTSDRPWQSRHGEPIFQHKIFSQTQTSEIRQRSPQPGSKPSRIPTASLQVIPPYTTPNSSRDNTDIDDPDHVDPLHRPPPSTQKSRHRRVDYHTADGADDADADTEDAGRDWLDDDEEDIDIDAENDYLRDEDYDEVQSEESGDEDGTANDHDRHNRSCRHRYERVVYKSIHDHGAGKRGEGVSAWHIERRWSVDF